MCAPGQRGPPSVTLAAFVVPTETTWIPPPVQLARDPLAYVDPYW